MNNRSKLKIISLETLKVLSDFSPFPILVIGNEKLLFFNEKGKEMVGQMNYDISIPDLYHYFYKAILPLKKELMFLNSDLERDWFDAIGELIEFEGHTAVLIHLISKTIKEVSETDSLRLSRLRGLMLEINQSILQTGDTHRIFHLILINAMKALENASLGSIFIKQDGYFEVASYIGFDKEIESFHLPVQDAFLYRSTDGRMDRIVNIPRIQMDEQFHPIKTFAGKEVFIKSQISSPIYINGELYGMINVDSLQFDAFDETDYTSMEFIRNNVEIAISNQLLYTEKSILAMHDQLTTLYNRHYFNEQFDLIKEKALRYNESFNFIIFDVDSLKSVNDRFGHLVGDQTLRKIAQELQRNTRKSDIIARYGGDEFIGVYFASKHEDLVEKFLAIDKALNSEAWIIGGNEVPCSFSFGIANFPLDGNSLEEMINVSDCRMYANKKKKLSVE